MMKSLFLSLVLALSAAQAHAADVPVYRTSATAIAKTPTVTITPVVGDAFLVFVLSDGHATTDTNDDTVTDDNGGSYWYQGQTLWQHPNGKWAKLQVHLRGQLLGNTTPTHVSVDAGSPTTAIAVVIAVSGLTLVENHPPIFPCGTQNTHSIKQVKCNGSSQAFASGETPSVPQSGQTTPFTSTSMLFAALGNVTNPPGVTVPSGWTSRVSTGTTAGGKTIGLSIATIDSGVTDSSVTWGSTSPSAGNALVVELQPLL